MAIGDGVSAIATLTLGFGGFSPTAFDGVEETRKQVENAEGVLARMREMQERRDAFERARTSSRKRFTDADGTTWTYVVVDDKVARIVACEPGASSLIIPEIIDGYPVYGLGHECCSRLDGVEEIICPDTVESIGLCAFRECPDLKRVVFPKNVAEFSAGWLSHCHALEELVLPGLLGTITPAVLDNENIRSLTIGPNVKTVVPGAFEKTRIETLELDEGNPYLITDGIGLYSSDGSVLVVLCKPVEHYEVAEGCTKIAKKACCNIHALKSIALPDSLEVIGKFAFAHSSLGAVSLPNGVRVIGEKAFFHCRQLEHIELNDGIARIDDSAFEESGLESLKIPASIDRIGASIIRNSRVIASGEDATIWIDPASTTLFLDGSGGLYRTEDDGVHLIQLIDDSVKSFSAHPSTRIVDDKAFALHDELEEAVFHEGLEEVGEGAFRVCRRLHSVALPDSTRIIGENAFSDSRLESFRVPASLVSLGEGALVTEGAHHLADPPTLSHIEVAEGNERFYMECGMLCEHADKGDRVVAFTGGVSDVVIPEGIVNIAPYALSNVRGIRSLSLPASLKTISTAGLAVWSVVEDIHIELATPVEGRTMYDFRFPATARSIHSISLALGGSSWVNVPDIMAQYDNCIANAHDYRGNDRDSISIYDQVTRVIERLRDPIMLTNVNKRNFDRLLNTHLEEICVDIARHDDRQAIDALIEFGYLNQDNLESIISAVGRLQDAAMTAYLLEVKRRRFNQRAFDFDL